MADGYVTLYLSNGQNLNILIAAAAAVGTNPVCSFEGTAIAGGNTDFIPASDCCVKDEIATISTAGTLEVYNVSRSQRSGKFVDIVAATYAVTVINRPVPIICFKGGMRYRFIQTKAQT